MHLTALVLNLAPRFPYSDDWIIPVPILTLWFFAWLTIDHSIILLAFRSFLHCFWIPWCPILIKYKSLVSRIYKTQITNESMTAFFLVVSLWALNGPYSQIYFTKIFFNNDIYFYMRRFQINFHLDFHLSDFHSVTWPHTRITWKQLQYTTKISAPKK